MRILYAHLRFGSMAESQYPPDSLRSPPGLECPQFIRSWAANLERSGTQVPGPSVHPTPAGVIFDEDYGL